MKKLLLSALIAVMVLGFGATAFAAYSGTVLTSAFSDIAGHDAEYELTALAALGVYSGSGIGSAVRPDDPITRAEFSKVVVTAIGRGGTAAGLAGLKPTFTDEVPAWAWGYVNVAVYAGIINGYEDGTFKPNNPVTYAEAVTMLIRAISGHKEQVPAGVWPYNYLFYGVDNGFTGTVDVGIANLPATRGDIARMTFATMTVPKLDKLGAIVEDSDGHPASILNDHFFHGVLTAYDLTNGTVSFAGPAKNLGDKVFLLGGSNLEAVRNVDVSFLTDKLGYVVFIGPYEGSASYTGVFKEFQDADLDAYYDTLVFEDGTKVPFVNAKIDVGPGGGGSVDTALNGDATFHETSLQAGDQLTVNLNGYGKAVYIVAFRENLKAGILATLTKSVGTTTDTQFTLEADGSTYTIPKTASVTINGSAANRDDLMVGDVMYVATVGATGTTAFAVRAVRQSVEGTVKSSRIVYTGPSTHTTYVTLTLATGGDKEFVVHEGDRSDFSLSSLPAGRGIFGLDGDGYIYQQLSYTQPSPWVLVKGFVDNASPTDDLLTVDLRGVEVTYVVDSAFVWHAAYAGAVGSLTIDPLDNKVTAFTPFTNDGKRYEVLAVDVANGRVTVQDNQAAPVTSVYSAPVIYKKATTAGSVYTYVPIDQVGLWDGITGTANWLQHASVTVGPTTYDILIWTYTP